ncbi:MAG: hypothetical protein QNL91_12975 [Candidatus Krumholzibacteria bacterium]|nr:hypothetical protein [Candidatus Krumholzibacteria bacterium]
MKRVFLLTVLALIALLALGGCDNDTENIVDGPLPATDKTCLGCHSSQDELLAALGKDGDAEKAKFFVYDKSDG